MPMVRTMRPPGAVSCAPNTCSMRARMRLFARFAAALAFDSGWSRYREVGVSGSRGRGVLFPTANRKPRRGAERSGWRSAPPRRIGGHHDDRPEDHRRQGWICWSLPSSSAVASKTDCDGCSLKSRCCPKEPARKVPRSIYEGARDMARVIAKSWEGRMSRRLRKKVEMLFAHLKRILKLDRLRLRGPTGARDEFLLAATAQTSESWQNSYRRRISRQPESRSAGHLSRRRSDSFVQFDPRTDFFNKIDPKSTSVRTANGPSMGEGRATRSPSAGDAQLVLDVGHHRVRQPRLAEFCEIIADDALP